MKRRPTASALEGKTRTLAGLTVLFLLPACASSTRGDRTEPQPLTRRQQAHMGTWVSISIPAPESPELLAAIRAAFAEVERLEGLLSAHRPGSSVSAVNRLAGRGAVAVAPELFCLAAMAGDVSDETGGAFDITFAALDGLWDFKAPEPRVPDRAAARARAELVGWRDLVLDREQGTLMLRRPGMKIGLGGIAKGYVVDRVSAVLRARGFADHLVIGGGDLYAAGSRGGRTWRVGVRDPRRDAIRAVIALRDEGAATSGDYERFFISGGVRYHHILDPRTGWPAQGCASVTTVAPSAALADAYATGLFVMGPEAGRALAERHAGLEALFLSPGGDALATSGMRERMLVGP
ncbi:MAG: FAD:protein FMN transferase [Deltaproteobacteria bacterium]|nr:FAD:protein FMN transferase [Deltaproteobacteria bacterium]